MGASISRQGCSGTQLGRDQSTLVNLTTWTHFSEGGSAGAEGRGQSPGERLHLGMSVAETLPLFTGAA